MFYILLVRPEMIAFRRAYVLLEFIIFFFFSPHVISELCGPIGAKFCMILRPAFSFIIPVQNFGVASPKFLGTKSMQNLA